MRTRTAVLLFGAAAATGAAAIGAAAAAVAGDRADARRSKMIRAAAYAFFSWPEFTGDWDRFAAAMRDLNPAAAARTAEPGPELTVLAGGRT